MYILVCFKVYCPRDSFSKFYFFSWECRVYLFIYLWTISFAAILQRAQFILREVSNYILLEHISTNVMSRVDVWRVLMFFPESEKLTKSCPRDFLSLRTSILFSLFCVCVCVCVLCSRPKLEPHLKFLNVIALENKLSNQVAFASKCWLFSELTFLNHFLQSRLTSWCQGDFYFLFKVIFPQVHTSH